MNIYFAGCSGQGKTTTANWLSKRLDMDVVDGLSRNSPHQMGSDDHQIYLSQTVFSACRNTENSIHCRTPFDVWAYSTVYERGDLNLDYDHAARFASQSPTVFYFPYWLIPKSDGFRPTSEELNKAVDREIRDGIAAFFGEVTPFIVPEGTPEYRVDWIIKALELLQ